jgi:hypothetical protein
MIGQLIVYQRNRYLSSLSTAEAFDQIYKRRMWQQGNSLSGCGSEGRWASEYVAFISWYVREHSDLPLKISSR